MRTNQKKTLHTTPGSWTVSITVITFLSYLTASSSAETTCPNQCTCPDEQKLRVDCSDKVLVTPPPGLSISTLTLDLSHNALGPIINDSFPQMSNLTDIDLSRNGLTRLLGCTLTGMLSLERVNLHGNRLSELPDSLFSDSNLVVHLDLSHNRFVQIPDAVLRHLPKLKYLDFSHNRIVRLNLGTRFQVPRLIEEINFSHNPVASILENDFDIADQWAVGIDRRINLAECQISVIESGAFRKIPTLRDIDLSGNIEIPLENLTSLVRELENRGLQKLSVANTNISTLEPLFSQVTHLALKFLNASYNKIEDIPSGVFANIRSLRVLDISHNVLPSLTDGFEDLVNLRILNISHNKLEAFSGDATTRLQKLRTLDISNNMLADADIVQLSDMSKLRHLLASNNLLDRVVTPENTSLLQTLDYHANSITVFPGLDFAENLEFFDISDNDLETVSPFLFKGGKLVKIANFSRNSIAVLDHRAFLPQSPLVVDLSHNFMTKIHFSNWVATQKLYLQDNHIADIDSQAFYGMNGLEVLNLAENKLEGVHEDLLFHTTGLKYLNLSHNGLNDVAWQLLFRYLDFLEVLDLGHNNITELDPSMLTTLFGLEELYLHNNLLKTILPRTFRDHDQLKLIDFSYNPFACDCDLLAFKHWIGRTRVAIKDLHRANSTAYHCAGPPGRVGVHVTEWGLGNFECNESMLYMIIFGSIGVFLVVAGVVGTAAYRLYLNWKAKRTQRRKRMEFDDEKDFKGIRADRIRLSSKEIAEEIQEALRRKEKKYKRKYEVSEKTNKYEPWPAEVKHLLNEDDVRKKEKRRNSEDRISEGTKPHDSKRDDREERQHYERLNTHAKSETTGKPKSSSTDERKAKEGVTWEDRQERRDSRDAADRGRDRQRHRNEDGRPGRSRGRSEDYNKRDPQLFQYGPESRGRNRSPPSRPYVISSRDMPPRIPRETWEARPGGWVVDGRRRIRDGRDSMDFRYVTDDRYLTLPTRGREVMYVHRVPVPKPRRDGERRREYPRQHYYPRHEDGYYPEARIQDAGRAWYEDRRYQSADEGHRYRRRAQSQMVLPHGYYTDEDVPYTREDHRDRAQRQYESIDQAIGYPKMNQKATSQPMLAHDNASGWL